MAAIIIILSNKIIQNKTFYNYQYFDGCFLLSIFKKYNLYSVDKLNWHLEKKER